MRRTLAAAISLALSVAAVDAFAQAPAPHNDAPPVVNATTQLPRNVRPTHYTIAVVPNAQALTFTGNIKIALDVLQPTDKIVLNAVDMQALFKNLISGVLVLIERPFRLGDVVEVGTLRGTVVDIDLRTSVIRDSDGADTLIPNSVLMEENVKNVTYRTRMQRQSLSVVLDGDSEPRAVVETMRAAAQRHGQLVEDPEPTVLLEDFADNGLRFTLHYWVELVPGMDRRRVASDLRMMILGAFADAGIAMAPPPPLVR